MQPELSPAPAPRAGEAREPGAIELHGLRKSFRAPHGEVHAVRGVNVRVDPGQTVALLGPNGAGKSTAIDMILGLAEPDEGTVEVFGAPPREAIAAGAVGAMLQTGGLLRDLSVRELIAMMASLFPAPLPVDEAIAIAGIGEIADRRTRSCPAARPSARDSRSPWWATRGCSCSTSRPSGWTSSRGGRSGPRCGAWPRAGARCSSPPTTSKRPTPTPTERS